MTPGERDVELARELVAAELAAWAVSPAELLEALPAAQGVALMNLARPGQALEAGSGAPACAAYVLVRAHRLGIAPVDGAGCRPSAGDLVRKALRA